MGAQDHHGNSCCRMPLGRLKDAGTMSPFAGVARQVEHCRIRSRGTPTRATSRGAGISAEYVPIRTRFNLESVNHLRRHRDHPPAHHRPRADRSERVLVRTPAAIEAGSRDVACAAQAAAGTALFARDGVLHGDDGLHHLLDRPRVVAAVVAVSVEFGRVNLEDALRAERSGPTVTPLPDANCSARCCASRVARRSAAPSPR